MPPESTLKQRAIDRQSPFRRRVDRTIFSPTWHAPPVSGWESSTGGSRRKRRSSRPWTASRPNVRMARGWNTSWRPRGRTKPSISGLPVQAVGHRSPPPGENGPQSAGRSRFGRSGPRAGPRRPDQHRYSPRDVVDARRARDHPGQRPGGVEAAPRPGHRRHEAGRRATPSSAYPETGRPHPFEADPVVGGDRGATK
jgi:hypothetical protein